MNENAGMQNLWSLFFINRATDTKKMKRSQEKKDMIIKRLSS